VFTSVYAQSSTPNELFKTAISAQQEGNYGLAIKHYTLAIGLDASRNYFFYNRGMTYKVMGQSELALLDFKQSLLLKQTAEAYYQVGIIKYIMGDLDGARANFENAKGIREDLENMNFYLGMIYYRNNRFEDAALCFQTFTKHVKTNADAYYYRGLAEAKSGKYTDAVVSFKFAMMYKNNDWKLYYKMYELYMAMNDKVNATCSLSMVIEMGEKKAEFYEERARLYTDLGDLFRAELDLKSAKEIKAASLASE